MKALDLVVSKDNWRRTGTSRGVYRLLTVGPVHCKAVPYYPDEPDLISKQHWALATSAYRVISPLELLALSAPSRSW
jgi:hypothetical protein